MTVIPRKRTVRRRLEHRHELPAFAGTTNKRRRSPRLHGRQDFNVAIVGATGVVGETLLSILDERNFPIGELVPLASERSAGGKVEFGNRSFTVTNLADFDFDGIDIAFFSAGGSVSREHAPRAAAAARGRHRQHVGVPLPADVPLVVSEVNPHAIAQSTTRGIIANPNCSTMQMLVALAPIHRAVGIERINVATYQSVSGAGRRALEELGRQTAALLNFQSVEAEGLSGADRVQRDPAHRRLHRQRLHHGRNEDGLGDAQDPRGRVASR